MPEQSIIVWDLETVPDLLAVARMLDLGDACEEEVRQALWSGFPKHPLHKIVCIGALIASRQPEGVSARRQPWRWMGDSPGPMPGPRPRPSRYSSGTTGMSFTLDLLPEFAAGAEIDGSCAGGDADAGAWTAGGGADNGGADAN